MSTASLCILAAWLVEMIPPVIVRRLTLLAILLHPTWVSVSITRDISQDTRFLASKWLAANGPSGRYNILTLDQFYRGIHFTSRPVIFKPPFDLNKAEVQELVKQCDVLAIESFATLRYERFPRLSPRHTERITLIRESYPYKVLIARDGPSSEVGFHNPRIELRFSESAWRAMEVRAKLNRRTLPQPPPPVP